MSLLDLFSKKTTQTSNTTNTDNSRVNTLTDSLNTNWNLSQTKADSRVYNSAFDAIDSFNTVNSYEFSGKDANIPALDFAGIRSLFNANQIDADPNANKYKFDFASQSQGSADYLKAVGDLVAKQWDGIASANAAQVSPQSTWLKWAAIALVLLLAVYLFRRK